MNVRTIAYNPVLWGILGGGLGFVTPLASPVLSFFIVVALWSFVVSAGLLLRGILSPDPHDLTAVMDHESTAFPLALLYFVCGSPVVLWVAGILPVFPEPGAAWSPELVAVASVGMVIWFIVGSFVSILFVFALADGLRRMTGRRGVQWT